MRSAISKRKATTRLAVRSKLTSKGQITLPAQLRRRLGLRAGDGVLFRMRGNDVIMEPQRDVDIFEKYRGSGTGGIGPNKGAILQWVREFRGEL